MESMNPLFNKINERIHTDKKDVHIVRTRKTRSDKTVDLKFPVLPELQIKLKMACKMLSAHSLASYGKPIKQTSFNTLLAVYALENPSIINWRLPYQDTRNYMHIRPKQGPYSEISGLYGYAMTQRLSERKTAYMLVVSALVYLESRGDLIVALQQS